MVVVINVAAATDIVGVALAADVALVATEYSADPPLYY